jgi:signal transduction histidine kinase
MKRKNPIKYIKDFFGSFVRIFKARSISTQMIITISLIFLSFFALQTMLNVVFFENFYTTQEFDRIHDTLMDYVESMNDPNDEYFDDMYSFTSSNNAYSVIVTNSFRVIESSSSNYTITLEENTSQDLYQLLIPTIDYEYTTGEPLTVTLYEYNNELYSPISIAKGSDILYQSENTCDEETCVDVEGVVTVVDKPNNMNYVFDENILVQNEISKLASDTLNPDDYRYDSGDIEGSWYLSTDGPVKSLVFIHDLKRWNKIVTVVPIVDTNDVVDIISNYNYYVYATAIVIIFIWSFRISSIMTTPIQNIELVARQIAQLNFDVEAHEYNSRENESLSRSINLIASNLRTTLETLNSKNKELMRLYDEQSKQVSLKKQLVSSISHELKTPLMIMQVTIQGILDGIVPEDEQVEEMNNILDEINKSSVMIQDMLQIYRLDDANTQLEISEFDLSKTVSFFLHDFENAIRKYNLTVDANLQDDVFVEADNKLLKRVISNFMTNAIKYTPENGELYIEVSEHKDHVYFELTNYGVEISEEELEKIWMPFYRIEREDLPRNRTKGSGIGLYLVSEVLKAHKADFGIINVENGVKAFFKLQKKVG